MHTALRNLQAGTESLSFMIIKKVKLFFRCKFKFKSCFCFQTFLWLLFSKIFGGHVPFIYSFWVGLWTAPKQNKEYFYNLLPTHFLFSPNHTHCRSKGNQTIKSIVFIKVGSQKRGHVTLRIKRWEENFSSSAYGVNQGGGLQIREIHRIKETDRGPLASHMQRARTIKQLKAGGQWIESEKTDENHYSFQITHKRQHWELESPFWGLHAFLFGLSACTWERLREFLIPG